MRSAYAFVCRQAATNTDPVYLGKKGDFRVYSTHDGRLIYIEDYDDDVPF